jgi:hypothetical protein
MTATPAYATPVSHGWPDAMNSRVISRQTRTPTAVRASHLICWRSSRLPNRHRTASDTNMAVRKATNTTDSPFSVPIRTVCGTGGRCAMPNGLGKVTETPPGAGSCTRRGLTTRPIVVTPASRKPTAATGRQRRDGSFPVEVRGTTCKTPAHEGQDPGAITTIARCRAEDRFACGQARRVRDAECGLPPCPPGARDRSHTA